MTRFISNSSGSIGQPSENLAMAGQAAGVSKWDRDQLSWIGGSAVVTGHTGFKEAWLTCLLDARAIGFALAPETEPNLFELTGSLARVKNCCGNIPGLAALRHRTNEVKPEVLHLSARELMQLSYAATVGTYAINVISIVHFLRAGRACPSVHLVVSVISGKAYENREWIWACHEDEAMDGRDPYSKSTGYLDLLKAASCSSFFGEDNHAYPALIASGGAGNVIGSDWSLDRLVQELARMFQKCGTVEIGESAAIKLWQHVLELVPGYLQLTGPADGCFAEAWTFGCSDEDCWPVCDAVARLVRNWGSRAGFWLARESSLTRRPHSKSTPRRRGHSSAKINIYGYQTRLTGPGMVLSAGREGERTQPRLDRMLRGAGRLYLYSTVAWLPQAFGRGCALQNPLG